MRSLVLLATGLSWLSACNCHPPTIEAPDAGEQPEPPDAAVPDAMVPDAGAEPEDAGVRFELAAELHIRARGIWSLDGQSVWVVGDANAIYRFDSRGWVNVAPPAGAGIDWVDVRGDRSSIWAVGERPDAGSFLYRSRTANIRPIEAEGASIQAPRLIDASERSAMWVGGADNGLGAILWSNDFGEHWAGLALPECPPVVGGIVMESPPPQAESFVVGALLADSSLLSGVDEYGNMGTWERTAQIATQGLLGDAFIYADNERSFDAVVVGAHELLKWDGSFGFTAASFVTTTPLPLDGFAPRALWGFAANDIWAVGEHELVFLDASGEWSRLVFPGEELVAIHGGVPSDLWVVSADGDVFHRVQ